MSVPNVQPAEGESEEKLYKFRVFVKGCGGLSNADAQFLIFQGNLIPIFSQ